MPNDEERKEVGDEYLKAPHIISDPDNTYSADTRRFQGISSLACGRDGRLWAVWYGGITPGEDKNNYVMLAISEDRGHTWSDEKLIVDPGEGPVRAFDPEIWMAPDGQIWLFWAQHDSRDRFGTRSGVWTITANESEGAGAKWSAPRRLCDGVMMCKPIVLSNGEWALPVSLWHKREAGSAAMWASRDQGRTWAQRGACDVPPEYRNHDEHMIVELENKKLWMLVRTNYGIGESISEDGGQTWSDLKPSNIPHPRSRFFICRLASGRLLLVRHDPDEGDFADGESKGTRSHLKAFLSDDEGKSWPHNVLLDERSSISYPDGDQDEEGNIFITYDHSRRKEREILMAAFTEEDILAGKIQSETARLKVLINKATG